MRRAATIVLAAVLWLPGCGSPTASAPLEPPPRGTRGSGAEPAETPSQFSAGLRVELDERFAPKPRFGVIAVVHGARGDSQTFDLGTYVGRVVEGKPVGRELAAIVVTREGSSGQRIVLVPTEDGIEARRAPLEEEGEQGEETGEEEVLERIPLPEDVQPVPREPALEIESRE